VDCTVSASFTDAVFLGRATQTAGTGFYLLSLQTSGGTTTQFYVRGDGYVWANNDITAFSDRRKKTDIKKIQNALDKVSSINGYTFKRTDDGGRQTHAGLIAQEVLDVFPEVVHMDHKGMYSVAYGNLTALLIEALKEERHARESLEERITKLETILYDKQ
jgi:hypothetical protein